MTQSATTPRQIRLQGIGWGPGTPAMEIRPGDRLMWNFGYISEVIAVKPAGTQSLIFTLRSSSGNIGTRRMKRDRLVARCEDTVTKQQERNTGAQKIPISEVD